ncbi:MAG: sulfatase-like hydrolase/transferase, partial [Saprospiraceae bacterium]|nr:sulfatase-like hydrolase/transferase [Saprospiraceae bacterium]
MEKTSFIVICIWAVLLFTGCQDKNIETNTPESKRPNFVLMMGDDHGWDEVGYHGHPFVKTPVLDEMAQQGLRLDRFYSGHPTCSPTRASFLTGRHPNRCGTFAPNWSIRPEEITIAQILKKAGYATAHFGKWHLGPVKIDSPTSPGAMGFDEWLSHDNFFEMDPILSRNGAPPEKIEGEGSQIIVEEAMQFIQRAEEKDQPFFVVIWYGSPHEPYSGLQKDLDIYDNLPTRFSIDSVALTSNETGNNVVRPLGEVLQERYAEITAMDRSIGEMRDFLKMKNLRDNTLVWYCGDNGTPASAARTGMTLRGEKAMMYEGGIRVPCIIEWPSQFRKGRISLVPSVTSDILPTLCALTNQPLPNRPLDGISLAPVFLDTLEKRDRPIYFWSFDTQKVFDNQALPYLDSALQEGTTPLVKMMDGKYTRSFKNLKYTMMSEGDFGGARAMISNDFKLVADQSPMATELFDLRNDSGETNNLSQAKPEVVENMEKQMYDWQASVLKSLMGD